MEQQTQLKIKPNVLINNKLYYDFDAAVKLTGRSKRTLQREMQNRAIQYLDYGKGKYFLPEWIDRYIERHVVMPKKFLKEART